MSDNVVLFNGVTRLDLPVDRILDVAKEHVNDCVIVIGYTEEGNMYFSCSTADGGDVLWLLEQAKIALLTV